MQNTIWEVINKVTIAAQIKQTLASLKSIEATLENFSSIEEDTEAKEILSRNARRINQVVRDFEKRLRSLEFEEPQYKGF